MKLSIVIAVLNSYKIVIRQIRHFKKMRLPGSVEIILVDDGSEPALEFTEKNTGLKNLRVFYTNDKRPWTQGLARNMGASKARGEYLFFTDIDHIITREAINAVIKFNGDKMVFPRYFGIFDRSGNILSDAKTILVFGLDPARFKKRGLMGGFHGNTYAIKKTIFNQFGGYNPKYCQSMFHVGGRYMSEERDFNIKFHRAVLRGIVKDAVVGPKIYHYPVSKFRADKNNNPGGLFHSLSLEQTAQPLML